MADKNFQQRNQSHQSHQDWEMERRRSNQGSDWSQRGYENTDNNQQNRNTNDQYGDVGYSGDSAHGMGNESYDNPNRVNYLPDNDDNRGRFNRDYEDTQYGTAGNYGYRNENSGRFGNAGNYSGQSDWNRRQYIGNMQGNQAGRSDDWSRRQFGQSGEGNWGSDYGRQDWGRGNVNTGNYGYRQDYDNQRYGNNYGNMNSDYSRDWERNRYGNEHHNSGQDRNNWWDRTKDKVSSWFNDDDNNRDRGRAYSGGHKGKGPSDYRRSEERIREDICDRLTDDDMVDASNIRIQMDSDAVILSGTVHSREEKRRAEDLVESISGVRNVENRLRVDHGSSLTSHEYTGNTGATGGIGKESGTTNEIIRNTQNERNNPK